MPEPTNQERADRCITALEAYESDAEEVDLKTNIVDLVADLGHLADSRGLDGFGLLEMALLHHTEEAS